MKKLITIVFLMNSLGAMEQKEKVTSVLTESYEEKKLFSHKLDIVFLSIDKNKEVALYSPMKLKSFKNVFTGTIAPSSHVFIGEEGSITTYSGISFNYDNQEYFWGWNVLEEKEHHTRCALLPLILQDYITKK